MNENMVRRIKKQQKNNNREISETERLPRIAMTISWSKKYLFNKEGTIKINQLWLVVLNTAT